jgi:hypothetical protein
MCFSQFAQYTPRPVYQYEAPERPEGAPPTKAELDENLFGPKPLPPQWQQPAVHEHGHEHTHEVHHHNGNGAAATATAAPAPAIHVAAAQNGTTAVTSVSTQTVEAVVVELSNGTKLLICPL